MDLLHRLRRQAGSLETVIGNAVSEGTVHQLFVAGLIGKQEAGEIEQLAGMDSTPQLAGKVGANGRPRKRRAPRANELTGHPLDGE